LTKALLFVALVLLAGCDPEVSSTNGSYVDVEKDVHCTHFSYCYTCMIGFGSKQPCGFKASAFCPGHQPALVRITDVRSILKSGRIRDWKRQEVIKALGACT
jgi:hypothetical protein